MIAFSFLKQIGSLAESKTRESTLSPALRLYNSIMEKEMTNEHDCTAQKTHKTTNECTFRQHDQATAYALK